MNITVMTIVGYLIFKILKTCFHSDLAADNPSIWKYSNEL